MKHFIVKRTDEETSCRYCGHPLLIGDGAVEAEGEIFCSRLCAKDYQKKPKKSLRKDRQNVR